MRSLLSIAGIFWFAVSASAAINFVQIGTGNNTGTAASSLSVTLPSPSTMGDMLVIYLAPGSAQPGTVTIVDSQGNVYVPASSTIASGQCGMTEEFFYAANIAGGTDTITASMTGSGGMALTVMEYSGVATSNPVDAQASASQGGCSSSTPSSANLATTNANELIVSGAVISVPGLAWTAGSGYALRTGANSEVAVEDQIAPAAGSYTASFTLSAPTNAIVSAVAFKPANDVLCGQLNDGLVHLPPTWDTFTPPVAGQSYIDPVFGCRVKRLTNSSIDETTWDGKFLSFMNYYSTFTPVNAADTLLFVISDDGNWRIKDLNGNTVVPTSRTPIFGGHPVWDSSNGNLFYYASYNILFSATVTGNTIQSTPLHTFSEYTQISSPDAADLSEDGDHLALAGQNANNTIDVFVWSLSKQTKTSIYTTQCTFSGTAMSPDQPACVHKVQLTADNLLSIQFTYDGPNPENGIRLWTGSTLVPLQNNTDHYDTGYDLTGNSIFVAMNNSDTLPNLANPCPSTWGLDVRPLSSMIAGQATSPADICLLDHPQYWHDSYRGSVSQPWIALSFFDARPQGPEFFTNDANYQEPPSASAWYLYEDEIILAKIDGTEVYRLAHARSRSSEGYWSQPRAAISRDGRYVIFTSNMAYPNGCPANMHERGECLDVYLINVH
jgi:hypothetical protein